MKSVLGMFKAKNPDDQSAVTENSNYVTEEDNKQSYDASFDDLEDDYLEDDDLYDESGASNDVFEEFTDKVQSLLDNGAMSLEIAEEKTSLLEGIDQNSNEYSKMVEEVKVAQAEARQNFDDAEFLIQRANEILESNSN